MWFASLLQRVMTARRLHRSRRRQAPAFRRGAEDRTVPASFTTVMSGLDNPRGLAFGPEGGSTWRRPAAGRRAVHRDPPRSVRLVRAVGRRFPPLARATGAGGHGPPVAHRSRRGNRAARRLVPGAGNAYVTVGLGTNPMRRSELGEVGAGFAQLVRLQPSGNWQNASDIGERGGGEPRRRPHRQQPLRRARGSGEPGRGGRRRQCSSSRRRRRGRDHPGGVPVPRGRPPDGCRAELRHRWSRRRLLRRRADRRALRRRGRPGLSRRPRSGAGSRVFRVHDHHRPRLRTRRQPLCAATRDRSLLLRQRSAVPGRRGRDAYHPGERKAGPADQRARRRGRRDLRFQPGPRSGHRRSGPRRARNGRERGRQRRVRPAVDGQQPDRHLRPRR